MKILLDESLPRRLARVLGSHEVRTVPEMGWAGMRNGDLLHRAESSFDVFLTADQNIQYQQNLAGYGIAVVVIAARTNRFDDIQPLIPMIERRLSTVQHGEVIRVEA